MGEDGAQRVMELLVPYILKIRRSWNRQISKVYSPSLYLTSLTTFRPNLACIHCYCREKTRIKFRQARRRVNWHHTCHLQLQDSSREEADRWWTEPSQPQPSCERRHDQHSAHTREKIQITCYIIFFQLPNHVFCNWKFNLSKLYLTALGKFPPHLSVWQN